MSSGYAALLCMLWISPRGDRLLKYFAPVGRMALTNYVGQRVICTLVDCTLRIDPNDIDSDALWCSEKRLHHSVYESGDSSPRVKRTQRLGRCRRC
ncbi:MAG: DUF418 domain-containing protein [Acidobacteriota bacterium]